MLTTQYPESGTKRYAVDWGAGDRLEVGIVRIGDLAAANDFTFMVYELGDGERRKLLEISQPFPPDSWNLFYMDNAPKHHDDGVTEIEYELKPAGITSRIACMVDRAKGAPPYYKDFAFVKPNVMRARKPGEANVILISFDTLRPDHLGCFGYPRPTSPHIDSFANLGVLFTQAISSSPWTQPAHFSLFTGLYPSASRTSLESGWGKWCYADSPLAEILRDHGYYTFAVTGGAHLAFSKGLGGGFTRYLEFDAGNEGSTEKIFENAERWLTRNRDVRFFLFVHHYECHAPYENVHFLERENAGALIEQRKALYDGDIRKADSLFGGFIEKLESMGLFSNSVVIVVSDHGEDFHDHFTEADRRPPATEEPVPQFADKIDHGHSVYEELVRVFVIFHLPGVRPHKAVLRHQVRLIDVMPTILDYLEIPLENPIQGTSLLDLIKTGRRSIDPPAVSEFTEYGPEQKSVRMNGYKYIYTPDPDEAQQGISYPDIPERALFDLKKDPAEKNNIYDENKELAEGYHGILEDTLEQSKEIKKELRERYKEEGKPPDLPEDVIESLKALGYL